MPQVDQFALFLGIYALLGVVAIIVIPRLQVTTTDERELRRIEAENESRKTVVQVVGGLGVVSSLFMAWRTLIFNERKVTSDTFVSLTERLGSDKHTVRFNALYELINTASSDPHRRQQVTDYITAWARQRSRDHSDEAVRKAEMAPAIRFIFGESNVLSSQKSMPRKEGIDLAGSDFSKLDLTGLNLSNVNLREANLAGTILKYCDLRSADITGANLEGSNVLYALAGQIKADELTKLKGANLQGADFEDATFDKVHFESVNLYEAKFHKSNLRGCVFRDTDFTKAHLDGADLRFADLSVGVRITKAEYIKATTNSFTKPPTSFEP